MAKITRSADSIVIETTTNEVGCPVTTDEEDAIISDFANNRPNRAVRVTIEFLP